MCQKGELPCPQIRHLMRSGCTGGRRQRIESLRERSNGRGGRDRGRALLIGQAGRRVGERGGRARLPARLALRARLRALCAASRPRTMGYCHKMSSSWTAAWSPSC